MSLGRWKIQMNREDYLECNDDRCVLLAEDFNCNAEDGDQCDPAELPPSARFNQVLADIAEVYPGAVLVGAVAAAKYIRHPVKGRETFDVDILLDEKDFAEFLIDEISRETLVKLETHFENSDSANHSLRHKQTGIYVDFLSTESAPIRKKLIRHVLEHPKEATHRLQDGGGMLNILKPEYLLAMKIIRHCKDPRTEKGVSDRLDIQKVLETLKDRKISVDHDRVRGFLNQREIKYYDRILADIAPRPAAASHEMPENKLH